tara:strand:+ start:16302 stop:16592 length:291 start_codon:yes stop_codon:yes gene_type:complete
MSHQKKQSEKIVKSDFPHLGNLQGFRKLYYPQDEEYVTNLVSDANSTAQGNVENPANRVHIFHDEAAVIAKYLRENPPSVQLLTEFSSASFFTENE